MNVKDWPTINSWIKPSSGKSMFTIPKGRLFIELDFAAIELRVLAALERKKSK